MKNAIFLVLESFSTYCKKNKGFFNIFSLRLSGKKPFEGKDCKTILRNNKKCSINFLLEEFKKVSPTGI